MEVFLLKESVTQSNATQEAAMSATEVHNAGPEAAVAVGTMTSASTTTSSLRTTDTLWP